MKQMVIPRDYPDLDYRSMNIYLIDAADRLLGAMSPKSSAIAERDHLGRGARIITDRFCRVSGLDDVYAIGDGSIIEGDEHYPGGHPQLAQVAIQQARLVARNLRPSVEAMSAKKRAFFAHIALVFP